MPYAVPTHGAENRVLHGEKKYDRDNKRFYNSKAWKKVRLIKLGRTPYCEEHFKLDQLIPATIVHHEIEVKENREHALSLENLTSLCTSCHSRLHAKDKTADV